MRLDSRPGENGCKNDGFKTTIPYDAPATAFFTCEAYAPHFLVDK